MYPNVVQLLVKNLMSNFHKLSLLSITLPPPAPLHLASSPSNSARSAFPTYEANPGGVQDGME